MLLKPHDASPNADFSRRQGRSCAAASPPGRSARRSAGSGVRRFVPVSNPFECLEPGRVARWVRRGVSVRELAAQFQVHRGTVTKLVRQAGRDVRRPPVPEPVRREAARLCADGLTLAQVSERFRINNKTVRVAVIASGGRRRGRQHRLLPHHARHRRRRTLPARLRHRHHRTQITLLGYAAQSPRAPSRAPTAASMRGHRWSSGQPVSTQCRQAASRNPK